MGGYLPSTNPNATTRDPFTGQIVPVSSLPAAQGGTAPNPAAKTAAPVVPQTPTGQAPPPFATMTPGNSPAYGTQSPTMFGTGTYTAPLLPINDQAITGAPAQGASTNYGLNSVWDNLNKELAAAPNQGAGMATATLGGPASYQAATGAAAQAQAAQGGYATAAPTALATSGNTIANQAALAHTLDVQANGGGISAADLQLQQGTQQSIAAQLAVLGSQRGATDPALAARAAQDQAAAANATLNGQMGIQRAQETQAAQQAEGAVLGAQGSQAAGINATAAGLQQQTELANAGAAQQSTIANTENAQQTALTNAAAVNAMTGQNLSAVNAANTGNAQLSQAQELANLGYSNQDTLANQQTELANQQLQNQQEAAVLGAQTAIGESNKASSLADQQLQLQQVIAANQVNEQGYASSAGANANLTGAVVGAAGSVLGAGITAAAKGGAAAAGGANGVNGTGLNLFSGTQSVTPGTTNPYYASSDENLKEGISGGNPMLQSFLRSYKDSTSMPSPAIDVNEGARFRNPTTGKAASGGSAGGGGLGSTIGGLLGGAVGIFGGPAGMAAGSAAGSAIGGVVGSGIDPATGGSVATGASPGSGVTVDETGWGQMPGMAMSDERQKTKLKDADGDVTPMLLQKALEDKKITSEQYKAGMSAWTSKSMDMLQDSDTQYAMDNADPNVSPSHGYVPMYQGDGWDKAPAPSTYNFVPGQLDYPGVQGASDRQAFQRSAGAPPFVQPSAAPAPHWRVAMGPAQDIQPAHPWQVSMGAPQIDASPGAALSDESEKDAVTSGNRGMQAFLSQANAQTGAQNSSGAQSNSFMQTGAPPSSQVDTQLPQAGAPPPFMQGADGVGYGMPGASQGGTVDGGGITNYGGYTGATMGNTGGVGRPPWEAQMQPADSATMQSLAMAHPQSMPTASSVVPTSINGMPASQLPPFAINPATTQVASNFGGAGVPFALSDEDEKVKTGNGGDVQTMLDHLSAYKYRYKDPSAPGAMPGQRLGVMAQDLEKSPLGDQFVRQTPQGKMVDYGSMAGTQLAASAMLNERLDRHEAMLKSLMGAGR